MKNQFHFSFFTLHFSFFIPHKTMLLDFVKRYNPLVILLIPVIGILLWHKAIFSPATFIQNTNSHNMLLFDLIFKSSGFIQAPVVVVILSFIFILIQTYLVVQIDLDFFIIDKRSFLSGIIFITLSSGFIQNSNILPVLLGEIFLIWSFFKLFKCYKIKNSLAVLFDSAFILSVGSLFYYNLTFYFAAILIGILILRPFYWREAAAALIGFVTPFFLYLSFSFLFSKNFAGVFQSLKANLLIPVKYLTPSISHYILFAFVALLILLSNIGILNHYMSKNISVRKYFTIFLWIFIVSIILFFILPSASYELFYIVCFPLSYLFTNHFMHIKSGFWSEMLFLLFLGIVFYVKFAN